MERKFKVVSKIIERHIYLIHYCDKVTEEVKYIRYKTTFNSKYLRTSRSFSTIERAREYREMCEEYIKRKKFERELAKIQLTKKHERLLDWPETLLEALDITPQRYTYYYRTIIPNFNEFYEEIKKILRPDQIDLLEKRYKTYDSLPEAAEELGLTPEGVRRKIQKIIDLIKRSSEIKILEGGRRKYELVTQQQRDDLLTKIEYQMTYETAVKVIEQRTKQIKGKIEDLGLNKRSYHALKRAGINKIEELKYLSLWELIETNGIGYECAKDIVLKLKEKGVIIYG